MTGPAVHHDDIRTDPPSPPVSDEDATLTAAKTPSTKRRPTRTGNLHAGLIIAAVLLVLLVVFLAQNAHNVAISFLGLHLHVSLAVALLAAALAGALIVGAAGAARITQLRLSSRRARRGQDSTDR